MPEFDHKFVIRKLKEAQDADHDNREAAREAILFTIKRDGQWEPFWWNANKDKPRYTFDMTTPVLKQISGDLSKADFDIKITPSGSTASKDNAKLLDGIVRNIESISNAHTIYNQAARLMIAGGISGWQIVQEFVDDDSFDQDLVIKPISNFMDRVWFDTGSELQDRSDASWAWKLQAIPRDEYDEKFPEGSGQSVSDDRQSEAYFHKEDVIVVGEFFFKKAEEKEIVLMSNGNVFEVNDDYERVVDELQALGITENKRRKRKMNRVFVRKFDNNGWLEEEKKTVFSWIPIIPTYGNFSIFENKIIYFGATEKLLDPQRVLNYSLSREIEEGALAPRAKYWMTEKQMAGHEATLATLNTNSDPVQPYNEDSAAPGPPQQTGGAQINPGLRTISESMRLMIGQTAGMFAANMGDNPGLQSGVAIDSLKETGDTGNLEYFESQEISICHTARILVDSIPESYEAERLTRILGEDGSFDMQTINQQVIDDQTGQIVTLNDLSVGKYDVTCTAGKSFGSRQQETVAALTEIASFDPSILQIGGDVLLNNVAAPGVDLIAERKRQQLFQAGLIPVEQMTDEEKELLQQQQEQPQQPDPAMVLAQAELIKGQADLQDAEAKKSKVLVDEANNQVNVFKAETDRMKVQIDAVESGVKVDKTAAEAISTKLDNAAKINKADDREMAKNFAQLSIEDLNRIAFENG